MIVPRWFKWSKTFSTFPAPGRIRKIKGVDEVKKIVGVKDIFLTADTGDQILPYTHSANRVNFINIVADSLIELTKIEEKVKEKLIYELE